MHCLHQSALGVIQGAVLRKSTTETGALLTSNWSRFLKLHDHQISLASKTKASFARFLSCFAKILFLLRFSSLKNPEIFVGFRPSVLCTMRLQQLGPPGPGKLRFFTQEASNTWDTKFISLHLQTWRLQKFQQGMMVYQPEKRSMKGNFPLENTFRGPEH